MCKTVKVIRGSREFTCEIVYELAAELNLPTDEVSHDGADACLCNVDWEKLGARRATDAEGWPFPDYIIERPNADLSGRTRSA